MRRFETSKSTEPRSSLRTQRTQRTSARIAAHRKEYLMNKHLLWKSGLLLSLAAVGAIPAAKAAAVAGGTVLATVNGEPITQDALVQRLLASQGKSTLEVMINRMLVNQEAKRLGIRVTDAEV